ncbi:phage tail protein [uncultured Haemophilus sp.]|uniref:phage tail protein n=1 Tax=uncultured Haemophilus sp. TaxID=237779 RepID=UPI00258BFCF8|nr:phage tail protein [uncultured Haemophilus sp.]
MKTLLPEINSSDKRFHNGDPATGEQGTRVTDTWLNDVQDRVRDVQAEAHYVLLKAGFTPKQEQQTQLYQAIVKIIDDNRKKASTTQKGEVQLYSGYDSDSEEMAATPKVIKILKGFIDSITRSFTNYIPNSKKSSAVNSNSADTVATSAAVKAANDNANGRVSKSGDTMTGMLTITSSSTTYRVNNYDWPKKIELSGDSVIGNEASVIGFNNNGTLHLGGKPNSSEFNASIDETRLWVKGDVVTKIGASLNNAFMQTGGVITGKTSFNQGDWSGIDFYNNSGRYARIESNPHGSNIALSFIYRESNGSNINVANLPKKNGNILLDADITYQKIGNFEVRKYPDGTMIQSYFADFTDVHGAGSGIGGPGPKQLTWAVSFVGKPLVWGNITSSIEDSHDVGVNILTKSTNTTLYWYNYEHSNPNQGACRLQFLAIGRWK